MASILIRKFEDSLKTRLRFQAVRHLRSMEEEAREILKTALAEETSQVLNLAQAIRRHIDPLGGVKLVQPARQPIRTPPKLTR